MIAKTSEQIEKLRMSGKILATVLNLVATKVRPGISAFELDQIADSEIRKMGGVPAFKNYTPDPAVPPFPGALCVSVNDEVVHGIPSKDKILKDGDIVGLDLGVNFQGFFTDSATTVPVGKVDSKSHQLIDVAKECLDVAIQNLAPGKTTGDIGALIEAKAKEHGFNVVRDLVGHGVGAAVHEDPEIPCYGKPGTGTKFVEGMVVAIEPMLTTGSYKIYFSDDHWTVKTADSGRSSHIEHTLLLTRKGCEILTNVV